MLDILKPALLRLVPYIASFLFGLIGVFVSKLGLGVYDEVAGTITISKVMVEAIVYSALTGGGLAVVAVLRGWGTRKSNPQ